MDIGAESDYLIILSKVSFTFQTTSCNDTLAPEITFEKEPPPIEWHLAACNDMDFFNILTVSRFFSV